MRDFVFVGDAVKTFMAAMEDLQCSNHHQGHDFINLCTGRATTINKLTTIIAELTDCRPFITNAPARNGDIRTSIGDPGKLFTRLELKLDTVLADGLHTMLKNDAVCVDQAEEKNRA